MLRQTRVVHVSDNRDTDYRDINYEERKSMGNALGRSDVRPDWSDSIFWVAEESYLEVLKLYILQSVTLLFELTSVGW